MPFSRTKSPFKAVVADLLRLYDHEENVQHSKLTATFIMRFFLCGKPRSNLLFFDFKWHRQVEFVNKSFTLDDTAVIALKHAVITRSFTGHSG